jgi:hypothetical protein
MMIGIYIRLMEQIVNIGMFIEQLTTYLKIGIYANKGTIHDNTLEKCIRLHNKYKLIETSKELLSSEEVFVRKCLKRLNLILKLDDNGNHVDIRDKENQRKLIFLKEHTSLINNDMNAMIDYVKKNNIDIFTGISLNFFLTDNKHTELLWNHTRLLFYISQILMTKINSDADKFSSINVMKQSIHNYSFEKLEEILLDIAKIEDNINHLMSLDNFLGNRLVKSGITKENVTDAKKEVKDMFAKKGLGENNSMVKMIDLISDNLTKVDLTGGNIMQCMFGIAQNVAEELRGDIENDPQGFQNAMGTITEVFQDAMSNNSFNDQPVPDEIKGMMSMLAGQSIGGLSMQNKPALAGQMSGPSLDQQELSQIAGMCGISIDEFKNSVLNDSGEINMNKLENLLKKC